MAVIPLESLPLGFRFHPTDEELVNHYLKGKIDGRIRSEFEVIPEIDVCKCEPWDLPDKALIRSDDPEWFFFSPKDRKYLNGHRSNRATEAGYWKATGKDRTIRTKAPLTPAVIGMKKTLVFHRGRAPKGVRTNWVMHEYRATEPEFEYGEQGGYVLYRLFRKAEEKGAGCNRDEIEQHGLSPALTKSFPCDTQHEADACEEFGTPLITEPLNQRSPLSGMQESTQSLLTKENQPSGITRWLADKAERSLKPQDDHVTIEPEAEAWAVLNDPKYEHMNSNSSHNFTSPMCLYSSDSFFNQGSDKGFHRVDNTTQNGSMDEFSNSILSSQDEYSGGGLNVRQMSTAEMTHSQSCSEVGTEVGIVQGDLGLHDPVWFDMDTSSVLYENTGILSYDNNGPDMHLVDSGAESLQGLFNGMESKGCIDDFSNEVCLMEETGISNVKIRTRRPQNPTFDNFSTQGFAVRRIRLQVDAFSSTQIDSSTKKEENENGEANQEIEDMKEHDPLIKLNDLSIHDDNVASLNIEESRRSKTRLRLRTKSVDGETKLNKVENPVLGIKTSGSDLAAGLFIWLVAMMAILVLFCFGISRLSTSHSLWFVNFGSSR